MTHLSDEQIMLLAQRYLDDDVYTAEQRQWIRHIGQCDECYDAFCCAAAILAATGDPAFEMEEEIKPAKAAAAKKAATVLAAFRVLREGAAEAVRLVAEQIESALCWQFEPALSAARSVADGDEKQRLVSAESQNSALYLGAETLEIQIDKREMTPLPKAVVVRASDGSESEYELLEHKGRFLTATLRVSAGDRIAFVSDEAGE